MEILDSFYYLGQDRSVEYVESLDIKDGVICHVYRFAGETAYDLGIVEVAPGVSTPLQQVVERFSTTVEGLLEGSGNLFVEAEGGNTFQVGNPLTTTVYCGNRMQWDAGEEGLTFFEICHPPYEEGRFENITS